MSMPVCWHLKSDGIIRARFRTLQVASFVPMFKSLRVTGMLCFSGTSSELPCIVLAFIYLFFWNHKQVTYEILIHRGILQVFLSFFCLLPDGLILHKPNLWWGQEYKSLVKTSWARIAVGIHYQVWLKVERGGRGQGGAFFSFTFASIKSLVHVDCSSTCSFLFDYCVNAHCLPCFCFCVFPDTYWKL